jgi:hypothetical protein
MRIVRALWISRWFSVNGVGHAEPSEAGGGTQAGTSGVVGDPGARARCAKIRSATRGSEIVAMRRSRPPQPGSRISRLSRSDAAGW